MSLEEDSHKWLIATDEAYFYIIEAINKKNKRIFRHEDWIEKPLEDAKIVGLVWQESNFSIFQKGIIY